MARFSKTSGDSTKGVELIAVLDGSNYVDVMVNNSAFSDADIQKGKGQLNPHLCLKKLYNNVRVGTIKYSDNQIKAIEKAGGNNAYEADGLRYVPFKADIKGLGQVILDSKGNAALDEKGNVRKKLLGYVPDFETIAPSEHGKFTKDDLNSHERNTEITFSVKLKELPPASEEQENMSDAEKKRAKYLSNFHPHMPDSLVSGNERANSMGLPSWNAGNGRVNLIIHEVEVVGTHEPVDFGDGINSIRRGCADSRNMQTFRFAAVDMSCASEKELSEYSDVLACGGIKGIRTKLRDNTRLFESSDFVLHDVAVGIRLSDYEDQSFPTADAGLDMSRFNFNPYNRFTLSHTYACSAKVKDGVIDLNSIEKSTLHPDGFTVDDYKKHCKNAERACELDEEPRKVRYDKWIARQEQLRDPGRYKLRCEFFGYDALEEDDVQLGE